MSNRQPTQAFLGFVAALLILFGLGLPAAAGGSWFSPVKDRYEKGDSVTLVGYTGGGAYGWIEDGPFFGHVIRSTDENGDIANDVRHPVGELTLQDTGNYGYTRLRVSITFELPTDALPGVYEFQYCNADCSEQLGDLIAGYFFVGIDPTYQILREWPLDEPEIANLDQSAMISGPGFETTAEEATENPQTRGDTTTTTPNATTAETAADRTTPAPEPISEPQTVAAPILLEPANPERSYRVEIVLAVAALMIAIAAAETLHRPGGSPQ